MLYSLDSYSRDVNEGKVADLGAFLWSSIHQELPADLIIRASKEDIDRTQKNIDKARADLTNYQVMSLEEAERLARDAYTQELAELNVKLNDHLGKRERWSQLVEQLEAWKAPAELQELRAYALRVAKEGVNNYRDHEDLKDIRLMSGKEYKAMMINMAEFDIKFWTRMRDDYIERAAKDTAFLKALNQSFPRR